jgi:hypothetical protein
MAADQLSPGDAFARWWASLDSSRTAESPEALARFAWDAAIRAAVVLLHREMDRLVYTEQYHEAAATRDGRQIVRELFTSPGVWSEKQQWAEDWERVPNSRRDISDEPFPSLVPLKIPAGWTVRHNSFIQREPRFVEVHDLWRFFHEDMLRLDNMSNGVMIDLGWYGDEKGEFRLEARHLTNPETPEMWRSKPVRELSSRSTREIVQNINAWLELSFKAWAI